MMRLVVPFLALAIGAAAGAGLMAFEGTDPPQPQSEPPVEEPLQIRPRDFAGRDLSITGPGR